MQLAAVTNSIQLSNCELQKNALVIQGELSHETVKAIAETLLAIEHCAMWWWGDFLCAVEARHGAMYDEALKVSSYSYSTLANAKWVCSKLRFSYRQENLSFSHHLTALVETKDSNAEEAVEWLKKAEENKWSVSELRKAIRLAQSDQGKTNDDGGGFNPIAWIDDGKRFWTKDPVESWDRQRCATFVEDTAWITELREKALARI